MNLCELNENIHQYPIRGKIAEPPLETGNFSFFAKNTTVIIPVFCPHADCMDNFRAISKKLINSGLKVLILEQRHDRFSYLIKFSEIIAYSTDFPKKLRHEIFLSEEKTFNLSAALSWAMEHIVDTKYVWINDPNFYVDFDRVIGSVSISECIIPVNGYKLLTKQETIDVVGGNSYVIDGAKTMEQNPITFSFLFSVKYYKKLSDLIGKSFGKANISQILAGKNIKFETANICGAYLLNEPKIKPVFVRKKSATVEKDMAIAVCHFNWCKYINPTRNLNRFLRQMDVEELPVYGVELSLNDQFETKERKNWKQILVTRENVCFQKEACINMVEKFIPDNYKKIAWIDSDLSFTNKHWYSDTSQTLETHKLVQMYSEGHSTDRYGRICRKHPGIIAMHGIAPMDYWFRSCGHPGGAWGARRELWKNGGLYPYCIVGGGDTVFIYTLYGHTFSQESYSSLAISGEKPFDKYVEWKNKITDYLKPSEITYIDNQFIHEWHGDKQKRNYYLRHELLKKIDIRKHTALDKDGLIELVGITHGSTYDALFNYFKSRDEDGVIGDMDDFLKFKIKLNQNEEQQ